MTESPSLSSGGPTCPVPQTLGWEFAIYTPANGWGCGSCQPGEPSLDMQSRGCVLYASMHNDLVFRALADPTRRLILDEFSERKEQTLYELTARLIMRHKVAISRQALAKHIEVLEKAGLVSSEKRGKYRMLVFNDAPLRTAVNRWLK